MRRWFSPVVKHLRNLFEFATIWVYKNTEKCTIKIILFSYLYVCNNIEKFAINVTVCHIINITLLMYGKLSFHSYMVFYILGSLKSNKVYHKT